MNNEKTCYYAFPGFADICHVMYRNQERFGFPAFLILCTLDGYKQKTAENFRMLYDDSQMTETVICEHLTKGDVFTRYSETQYLILKMGDEAECEHLCRSLQVDLQKSTANQIHVKFSCSPLGQLKPSWDRRQAVYI